MILTLKRKVARTKDMKSTRYFLYTALIFLTACTASAQEESYEIGEKFLFLIHAGKAEFSHHEANPLYGKIVLSDVSHSVSYFTEPPKRQGGTMPIEDFLENWSRGQGDFQKVPANSAFVFYEGQDEHSHDVSIELRKPIYNATNNTLSFNIYFIDPFERDYVTDITLFIESTGSIRLSEFAEGGL